jgi:hypothetical protein
MADGLIGEVDQKREGTEHPCRILPLSPQRSEVTAWGEAD